MNRCLLACAIIGLWLICLTPTTPGPVAETPSHAVTSDPARAVHPPSASADLGPSVGLSYTFPALLAASAAAYSWGYMGTSVDGGSMTDSHLSTLNTLPFAYYFYYYDIAGSYTWVAMDVVTVFQGLTGVGTYNTQHDLQVCYSGITTFTWNITTWFYDIATNAWVQQDCHVGAPTGPGGTYTLLDTPSLTYTTSYIDATGDFRVKVRGWAQIVAAGGGYILGERIRMNQPRTTRTTMTETRRPTYTLTGGTVLYTLSFMAPESMTTVTATYPTAWDWQSLQPNANVAETSGQIVITNTDQDTVYSASFTANALATANRASVFSDSWESGVTRWQYYWGAVVTLTSESVTVLDGAASLKAAFPASSTGFWIRPADVPIVSGSYWVVFSLYATAAVPILFYRLQSTVWTSTTHTTTANAWTTFLVPCPAWSPRTDFAIAFMFYHTSTAVNLWLDGFTVYNSTVSVGYPITGRYAYLHPNGAVPASFATFNYNCTTFLPTNTPKVTDALGNWSITPTWATTPGTYTFYTCNPSAAADSTTGTLVYPFTRGTLVTMTFCFRQADATPIAWPTPWIIYVQGSRLGSALQYTTTLFKVNLTVVDLWGVKVYQNTSLIVGAYVDLTMPVYTLILQNRRGYPQDVKITHGTVDFWLYGIGEGMAFTYLVYAGSYTISWYKQGEYANPTDPAYTFTVTAAPVVVSSGVDLPTTNAPPQIVLTTDWWALMLVFAMAMGLLFAVYKYTRKGRAEPAEPPAQLKPKTPLTEYERRTQANAPQFHAYDRLVKQEQARRAAEGGESSQ